MLSRLSRVSLETYLVSAAVLIFVIIILAMVSYQRGREIEILKLQVKTLIAENNALADENTGLKKSAQVVSAAAQAQSIVCQLEMARRAAIEEITEAAPASKPETAVNDQASRKALHLLNTDLFAPFGGGLHRAAGQSGSAGSAVPGSGSASHAGSERE